MDEEPSGRTDSKSWEIVPFREVDKRWRYAVDRLEGAYAASTVAACRSNFSRFSLWCQSRNLCCLPAAPEVVAQHLEQLSSSLLATSLKLVAGCIGKVHRLAGEVDPTRSVEVFLVMRRAARQRPYVPRQAFGLTADMLRAIAAICPGNLVGLRDRAMIWVGFETLCRGSEISELRAEDLIQTSQGATSLLVRKGKTDQTSRGRTVVLSPDTSAIVRSWLHRSGISRGRLLPRLDATGSKLGPLTTSAISRILKARARQAGIGDELITRISSHSLRVGGAQQLTMMNRNLAQIMRAGGWRSIGTVSRYIEGAENSVWDEGVAPLSLPVPSSRAPRVKGWA